MNLRKTLVTGGLIRLLLMPFFAHPYDVFAWYTYYLEASSDPLSIFQTFPHFWKLTLLPLFSLYEFLSGITGLKAFSVDILPPVLDPQWGIKYVPGVLFNFIGKTPMFIADMVSALLLHRALKRSTGSEELADKAALWWYLNPLLIWISAGRGMWDSLPALFSLASIYYLSARRIGFSAVALAVSVLFKLYSIIFLIPMIFFLYRGTEAGVRIRSLSKFLLIFIGVLLVDVVPYLTMVPSLVSGLLTPTPFYGIAGFGLTYWSVSVLIPEFSQMLGWGPYAVMTFMLGLTVWRIHRQSFKKPLLDLSTGLLGLLLAVFLSYNFVAEHFLIWALPFIVITCVEKRVEKSLLWLSSLAAFIYAQKNFPYYLLPIYPWFGNTLEAAARLVQPFQNVAVANGETVLMPSLSGGLVMTVLGVLSSALFIAIYLELFFIPEFGIVKRLKSAVFNPPASLFKSLVKDRKRE